MNSRPMLLEEMDEDDLTEADVRQAMNGRIANELTEDQRGLRFLVRGKTADSANCSSAHLVSDYEV